MCKMKTDHENKLLLLSMVSERCSRVDWLYSCIWRHSSRSVSKPCHYGVPHPIYRRHVAQINGKPPLNRSNARARNGWMVFVNNVWGRKTGNPIVAAQGSIPEVNGENSIGETLIFIGQP